MADGSDQATSVVVSTYDEKRWSDLEQCLQSLERQTLPPLEAIVVVDHNPAQLQRAAESFPKARVLANERSRGLSGARNSGGAVARGELIAFIDDDAQAEPEWLERLQGCFRDPVVVGAGGALLPLWEDGEARWIPREFYWVFGCSYTGLPEETAPVRNPIGANMAVRKSVLWEVNGFREGDGDNAPRELRSRGFVRAGGNVPDDTDFAIRVAQHRTDAVFLYEPRARVLHTVTPERSSLGYFLRRCFEEGSGKAALAGLVGAEQGLASERRHAAAVLPRGVLREFRRLLGGDGTAALRAGAIVIGTVAAAAGFALGTLRRSAAGVASQTIAMVSAVRSGKGRS